MIYRAEKVHSSIPLTEGGSVRTVEAKAQKGGSMRLVEGSVKAKGGEYIHHLQPINVFGISLWIRFYLLSSFDEMLMYLITEKTGANGGSMRTVDAKAQKSLPLVVEEGSIKAKAKKTSNGGSMRIVASSMRSKAGEQHHKCYLSLAFRASHKTSRHLLCIIENRGSMRTVTDTKAQKSIPLVENESMKAKAEKASSGGSMRLVDNSMKTKAGK